MGGSTSKLYGGGGLVVAHSRVLPSHGSSDAVRGSRSVTKTFHRKGMTDRPIRKAPIVERKLSSVQPGFGA